jgi:thiol-disulfide isomerase/thioredoxin
LLAAALVVGVFFASYFYFLGRHPHQEARPEAAAPPAQQQVALPEAHLVDLSGADLPDEALRKGKVVLVFVTPDCDACQTEAEFLKKVAGRRGDVAFYGVVSFGEPKTALEQVGALGLPFKVYFDDGHLLAGRLGVRRVPIKLFVEDGVIKKLWGGATNSGEEETAFAEWLEKV